MSVAPRAEQVLLLHRLCDQVEDALLTLTDVDAGLGDDCGVAQELADVRAAFDELTFALTDRFNDLGLRSRSPFVPRPRKAAA